MILTKDSQSYEDIDNEKVLKYMFDLQVYYPKYNYIINKRSEEKKYYLLYH